MCSLCLNLPHEIALLCDICAMDPCAHACWHQCRRRQGSRRGKPTQMTAHEESFQVQSMFEVGKAKARPWHWRLRVAISARRAFSLRSIFHSNSCCIFFFSCCMLTVVAMLWLADLRGVSPEAGCCRRFSAFLFRFSSSNSACVCISFSLSTAASRLASSTSRCS